MGMRRSAPLDVLQKISLPSLKSLIKKLPFVRVNLAESLDKNAK